MESSKKLVTDRPTEVGIHKRKQESKKTRKQELDQESDQDLGRFLGRVLVFLFS